LKHATHRIDDTIDELIENEASSRSKTYDLVKKMDKITKEKKSVEKKHTTFDLFRRILRQEAHRVENEERNWESLDTKLDRRTERVFRIKKEINNLITMQRVLDQHVSNLRFKAQYNATKETLSLLKECEETIIVMENKLSEKNQKYSTLMSKVRDLETEMENLEIVQTNRLKTMERVFGDRDFHSTQLTKKSIYDDDDDLLREDMINRSTAALQAQYLQIIDRQKDFYDTTMNEIDRILVEDNPEMRDLELVTLKMTNYYTNLMIMLQKLPYDQIFIEKLLSRESAQFELLSNGFLMTGREHHDLKPVMIRFAKQQAKSFYNTIQRMKNRSTWQENRGNVDETGNEEAVREQKEFFYEINKKMS
jgi:hypothetical protein